MTRPTGCPFSEYGIRCTFVGGGIARNRVRSLMSLQRCRFGPRLSMVPILSNYSGKFGLICDTRGLWTGRLIMTRVSAWLPYLRTPIGQAHDAEHGPNYGPLYKCVSCLCASAFYDLHVYSEREDIWIAPRTDSYSVI